MKTRTMNVLTPLAALAFAFGAQAFPAQTEGFETITAGQGVGAAQKFVYVPPAGETVTDASVVTAYGDNDRPDDSVLEEEPASPFTTSGDNYLKLSTEDGTLLRSINALNEGAIGAAATIPAEGITIDTVMQFTATDSADRPVPGENDKFTMWLDKDGDNVQLMVCGGKFSYSDNQAEPGTLARADGYATYVLRGDFEITAGSWHRVTIIALANANAEMDGGMAIPAFQIFIDGTAATARRVTEDPEDGIFTNQDDQTLNIVANCLCDSDGIVSCIPSLSANATLAAVGFAGEGKIDDLVINDNSVVPVTFTIETIEGYTVDLNNLPAGVTYDNASGEFTAENPGDYTFTFVAADGKLFSDGAKSKTKQFPISSEKDEYAAEFTETIVDAIASFDGNEYLDITAAYNAAKAAKGGTVTLLTDTESGVLKWKEEDFTDAFVFDLGGKTLTFDCTDSKYAIQITKGTSSVTIKNGKIKAKTSAEGKSLTTVFQNYAHLVVEDVEIDAENFNGANAYWNCTAVFAVMNGSAAITGSTAIKNNSGYVLSIGNHTATTDYANRAVTIDTTGTLSGDFLFCGGTVTYVKGTFDDDAKYYYGVGHTAATTRSAFAATDLVNFPLVARVGQAISATPDASVANGYEVFGQFYVTADEAFAAANDESKLGIASISNQVEIVKDCSFAESYVISNNMELAVAKDVTLTRENTKNYPFIVAGGVTLTLSGEGTILKPTTGGTSTLICVGTDDAASADEDMGTVVLTDCGLKVIDLSGSNTISIDAGKLVMNGGYVENGNAGGFAIRVSSKVAGGDAAIIDLNKGSLVAVNSPIGVKADAGKTATASIADSAYWLLSGVKGSTSYYGKIKINLEAGDTMRFSNDKSDFAPRGYAYIAKTLDEATWYVYGIATYTITVTDGTTTLASYQMGDQALTATLAYTGTPETGKEFDAWELTKVFGEDGITVDGNTLTIAAGAVGNISLAPTFKDATSGTNPGESAGEYNDAQAATNACAGVTAAATDAVKQALTTAGVDEATYLAKFTGKVVDNGNGTFSVVVGLTAQAEGELQAEANSDAAAILDDAENAEITTTPGFYYSLKQGDALDGMAEGDRVLATGAKLGLDKLGLNKTGTAGFYKILINIAPKDE